MDQGSHIFDVTVDGRTVIVTPKTCLTEFDFAQIELEGKRVAQWIEQQDLSHVLLDLANSDYFGSSAVGFFMKLWKWARTRRGKMAVANSSKHALELIHLIQADKLWYLAESRAAGLAWLASQGE
ncbi:MAG: STAS domain-containing protein [Pirellulales bacterium]